MLRPLPPASVGRRLAALALLLAAAPLAAQSTTTTPTAARARRYDVRSPAMPAPGFVLASRDVRAGGSLTRKQEASAFGCAGQNVSPALEWTGAPRGTKSFAVTLFDPDAPTGSGFWHWIVYDLPASTASLASGAGSAGGTLPPGAVQATTDFGARGFGGACPPPGDGAHRYLFTVHALRAERLDVPAGATPAVVGFALHAQTIATAAFTARYAR
jgi:Raf kinase inhibitor-like YbhB/YbcL family protein